MRFVDAHTHLELFALRKLPFERFSSVEELLASLEVLEEDFTVAWGWDEKRLGRSLTREDLDRVDRPILLLRTDAHVGVANSRLIEELGLDKEERFFEPERGFLYENLLWEVVEKLKPKGEPLKRELLRAARQARNMGILEVHDYVDLEIAELYLELEDELPVRVVLMPYYESYREVVELVREGGEKLKLGWVKVFVDGSIGARTAYLRKPYEDRQGWRGILLKDAGELVKVIDELEGKGLRVSLHAIGDGAVEECLKAFEKVSPELKFHRIEHAVLISREQALRAKERSLLLCLQPNFKTFFRETYLKALGRDRWEGSVPIAMLGALGVDMVFGSDMMPFDPNYGFRYAKKVLGERKAKYYYGGWRDEGRYL